MAPFSNRAFISCSNTRTCWWATSVDKTPMNLGGRDPNCIWYPFSIVCRTQWDIFGRSFHAIKHSTIGTSLSRLVSGFVCIYAVRMMSWSSELTGSVWADRSKTLLRGGGHPQATKFPGGSSDMRSPETAAPWSTRGGRVGRPVPWGHRRETGTVKWGVNCSTSRGEVLTGLSPRASGPFPRSLLRSNNSPQIRFNLWRLRLSVFTVSPVFMWGSTISHALLLCGTVGGAGFRCLEVWIQRRSCFWNATACLADSWNLSTAEVTAPPKRPEGEMGA